MKKKPKIKTKVILKRFVIKKYIMAKSAQHALKLERNTRPDDVWVDDDWKKENPNVLQSAIGYEVATEEYYD